MSKVCRVSPSSTTLPEIKTFGRTPKRTALHALAEEHLVTRQRMVRNVLIPSPQIGRATLPSVQTATHARPTKKLPPCALSASHACPSISHRTAGVAPTVCVSSEQYSTNKEPVFPTLPEGRKVLVLDLDETLVRCTADYHPFETYDATYLVPDGNGNTYPIFVQHRPYLLPFLRLASQHFTCVLFTAATMPYADAVMDGIDPDRTVVPHRLYREHCTVTLDVGTRHPIRVKDLSRLGCDLRNVAIIDNTASCFRLQPHNGIHITSWYGDAEDCALTDLLAYFHELSRSADVCPIIGEINAFLYNTDLLIT